MVESAPKVSVIITAYNSASTITAAINSALQQTVPPYEVIVIDDGSTDSTADLVAGYSDRVRLVRQSNQGPSAARNTGLAMASGDFIAFLDGDDTWHPEKLAIQLSWFKKIDQIDLIATSWTRSTPELRGSVESVIWLTYADLITLNRFQTSTAMVRTSLAQRVGTFDSRLDGVEDWDYWIRCSRSGTLALIDQPLVHYHDSSTGVSKNLQRYLETMSLLLEKHRAGPHTPTDYRVIESWHYQRMLVAMALNKDSTGTAAAWHHLKTFDLATCYLATTRLLTPFLIRRLARRLPAQLNRVLVPITR